MNNPIHQVQFECMLERLTEQTVWCEIRDGVKVFVFASEGVTDRRTVVSADNYLHSMQAIYNNPVNSND